jgi:hypothetical protein
VSTKNVSRELVQALIPDHGLLSEIESSFGIKAEAEHEPIRTANSLIKTKPFVDVDQESKTTLAADDISNADSAQPKSVLSASHLKRTRAPVT